MLNEQQRERDAEGTRPWRWKMKKAKCTSVSVRSFHFKTQGDLMLLYRELSSCYRTAECCYLTVLSVPEYTVRGFRVDEQNYCWSGYCSDLRPPAFN